MLSPTAWWLVLEPVDLRAGAERLLTLIQSQDAMAGAAYVFRTIPHVKPISSRLDGSPEDEPALVS